MRARSSSAADDPACGGALEKLLASAFESGEPEAISHALGMAARAYGMSHLAAEIGVVRQTLYRGLSQHGNPAFSTVIKAARVLGFTIRVDRA